MELQERVELFQELLGCCHRVYLWIYDAGLHLISTDCPQEERDVFQNLLLTSTRQDSLRQEFAEIRTPMILSNSLELMWSAVPFEEDGDLCRFYILGPVFIGDISSQHMIERLQQSMLSPDVMNRILEVIRQVPSISWSRLQEYTVMLHDCVNREKIDFSALRYLQNQPAREKEPRAPIQDVHGTYALEKEMLRMVREGDLGVDRLLSKMAVSGTIGNISNGDPLRQMKNIGIVCTTLFSRAAIDGGMSAELSLSLTDRYVQEIESSRDISEASEVIGIMQSDFVHRVHAIREGKYSVPVNLCCDYIDLHLEEKLTIADLARETHYAEYYLSKKFKKETGQSVAEYIRSKRLSRAAEMLQYTREDIQSICDRFQFGTHSYFTDCFRRQYGVTPSQYREGSQDESNQKEV